MAVNWSELWDQTDSLANYTQKGIEFLEKIGTYAKERAAIEEEYASKLKALSKKTLKKKEDEELWKAVSFVRGFGAMLKEVESVAAQHETIAECLKQQVSVFATTKANQHRATRKQTITDLQHIHAELNNHVSDMSKAQKQYAKTFKDAENAFIKFAKAEKNMELSRLDLEKARNNATNRNGICEEAKQAYAFSLSKTNDEQSAYFNKKLPEILERFKNLDMERVNDTKEVLNMCVNSEANVHPIIGKCHLDMRTIVTSIDSEVDARLVIDTMKSGIQKPGHFIFEDLGHPEGVLHGGAPIDVEATLKKGTLLGRNGKGVVRKQSMHQKFFGGDKKNDTNGDYATLPPQQRARKLVAKIAELEKERDRALQGREGVCRMQSAYRENPKMGNPNDCEPQLIQYGKEIESLSGQINRYRAILDDVNGILGNHGGTDTPTSLRSTSSASNGTSSLPAIPSVTSTTASHSHEHELANDDLDDTTFSLQSRGGVEPPLAREEFYEDINVASLGKAFALFSFESTTDNTLKMTEGEEFALVERDEGDGWTRVRRSGTDQEGFVPSSYLRIEWKK